MPDISEKSPVGRPSKYDLAYCAQVIEFMGRGFSLTAFAGEISVARSTINEWMDAHPEFREAVKVGQAKRTQRLEEGLLAEEVGPKITARIFALKNADPEGWRDKHEIEHAGKDGGPIRTYRIERVIVDPKIPDDKDPDG